MDERKNTRLNQADTDINIPIDTSEHDFQFTTKWFSRRNQITWSTYFINHFCPEHFVPVNMLQIGVWEGMDLVWCLQNILCHDDSRATAIDPWAEMLPKHPQAQVDEVRARALHNLKPWRDKVAVCQGESQKIMPALRGQVFDLIVIDGNHTQEAVYQDARLSLDLSKSGTWLVFDDVRSVIKAKKGHVYDGIQKFVDLHGKQVKEVWRHRYCDCYEVL